MLGSNPRPTVSEAQISDAELVRLALDGKESAARSLFDRYQAQVNFRIRRLMGTNPAHDDVAQNVWSAVFLGLPGLKNRSSFDAWLGAITINAVRQALRPTGISRLIERGREVPDVADDTAVSPSANQESLDLANRVYAALGKLKVDQRIAYMLKHVEDLTIPEISRETGRSESSVKRDIAKARERLRHLMGWDPILAEYLSNRKKPG